jgi:hypothetical protein
MKIQSLYNIFLGIATEILYAIAIILAAFLLCVAACFLKL